MKTLNRRLTCFLQISRDTAVIFKSVVPMGNTAHWFCSCLESSGVWTGISRLVGKMETDTGPRGSTASGKMALGRI